MSVTEAPPSAPVGRTRNRPRRTPKGRQVDPVAAEEVAALLTDRSRRRDLLIEHLHLIQDKYGHISAAHLAALAAEMKLAQTEVYEVASFYSMFETTPVGRNNVAVCTNISCWLNGGEDILKHCENKLGIKVGESTPDGRVYLKCEEECLAACAGAPMMVVNGHYHEHLSTDDVDEILDGLK